jgi:PTS system nitrogen regulatory IIA component
MRIVDILTTDALIVPALSGTTKTAVLRELAEHLARQQGDIDAARLVEVLGERERLGSTAIGDGIAIPHGKLPGLKGVIGAFGRHPGGVDFDSLDGSPTHLFFLLVAPEESVGQQGPRLSRQTDRRSRQRGALSTHPRRG